MSKPVAITVSTNYSDILPFVLAHNLKYFEHWYIITDQKDTATIEILKQYDPDKITIMFWNFQNVSVTGNGRQLRDFDKGGAIRLAQSWAHLEYPDNWYLILDSDIMLRDLPDLDQLDPNCVYGPSERLNYSSWTRYQNKQPNNEFFIMTLGNSKLQGKPQIIGFFQLYKQSQHYYEPSHNTNWCDNAFTLLWPEEQQIIINNFTVDHLGDPQHSPCTHTGRQLGWGFDPN